MAFYENTIVAKQDLSEKELKIVKDKYNDLINHSSGKVVKIEETDYKQTPSGVNPYLKLILETGEEIYNSYILHGDI